MCLGAPNLARARRLSRGTRAQAILNTCNTPNCAAGAQIVRDDLAAIGIEVTPRALPVARLFALDTAREKTFDLAFWNYAADFPDPSDFINLQFQAGRSLLHLSGGPALNRRMQAAARLTGARRYRAYAELDHDLTANRALAAPYATSRTSELFSKRIGCQVYQPIYGIDLGSLCLTS